MSERVRLPPLPDSGDVLRSMTVIPYLDDMYHASDDDDYDPRDPDEIDERVIAVTDSKSIVACQALLKAKYCPRVAAGT